MKSTIVLDKKYYSFGKNGGRFLQKWRLVFIKTEVGFGENGGRFWRKRRYILLKTYIRFGKKQDYKSFLRIIFTQRVYIESNKCKYLSCKIRRSIRVAYGINIR